MTSPFPTRQLGKGGPKVPALGFGLMGLSVVYGGKVGTDEERFKVLDRALELGETFWDSADIYADSEELIGKWFRRTSNRSKIFLATKFAFQRQPSGSIGYRCDPEYVRAACEKSLGRLGIEKIDLYYMHRTDGKTPIEETVAAMAELKKEGKIEHLGLSEVSSETLRRAHKVHPISAVQVEYSPFALDIESDTIGLLKTCRELGVAVVAYSPLGRGFLTGQIRSPSDFDETDYRRYFPRYSAENFPKNLVLVDQLEAIAKEKGCTSGQLSLAFLMSQGDDIIPIPGTKNIKYLEENIGSLEVILLAEDVKKLRKLIDEAEVHGGRYPQGLDHNLYADTPALKK